MQYNDDLNELMNSLSCTENMECDIIYQNLNKTNFNETDIHDSIIRYNRYLDSITIWTTPSHDFSYLKEMIEKYLHNVFSVPIKTSILEMIKIDYIIKSKVIEKN